MPLCSVLDFPCPPDRGFECRILFGVCLCIFAQLSSLIETDPRLRQRAFGGCRSGRADRPAFGLKRSTHMPNRIGKRNERGFVTDAAPPALAALLQRLRRGNPGRSGRSGAILAAPAEIIPQRAASARRRSTATAEAGSR